LGWLKRQVVIARGHSGKWSDFAKGSTQVSLLRIVGVGCSFVVTLIIARTLGAAESGVYFLTITIITIVASVIRLGLEHALTRFVSVEAAAGNWVGVNGAYLLTIAVCSALAMLGSILLYVLAPFIASQVFDKPELSEAIRLASWAVLPTVVYTLQAHAVQGRKEVVRFVVLQLAGLQMLMLVGCAVVLLLGVMSVTALLVAYSLIAGVLAVLGLWWWWVGANVSLRDAHFPLKPLLAAAMPLFVVVALNLVLAWSGHLSLGVWGTTADVAIFSAAYRISTLLMLVSTAITNVVAPEYAAYHAAGNTEAFSGIVRWATRSMILASLPLILPLVVVPSKVMSLMGADFAGGGSALGILVLGQAVNVVAGYPSFILIMTGHERDLAINVAVSALVMFLAVFVLVPRLGVNGAAFAQSLSLGLQATLNSLSIRRRLGILSWRFA
jgi:O-antigen/teichoic acid export membrane protein